VSKKEIISTRAAPQAIGPYSQAVKINGAVYLSGQIPLHPATMTLVEGDITAQAQQVFNNLSAVAEAAGGSLDDAVKINISLTDLGDFAAVNEVMAVFLANPTPPVLACR